MYEREKGQKETGSEFSSRSPRSAEPTWDSPKDPEIMTRDRIKSQLPNQRSCPGAPGQRLKRRFSCSIPESQANSHEAICYLFRTVFF